MTRDVEAAERAVFWATKDDERADKAFAADLASGRLLADQTSERNRSKVEIPADPSVIWYRDQGYYQGPEVAEEISKEDRAFAFSAEGEFVAHCQRETGAVGDEEKIKKRVREAVKLLEQTVAMAEKMRAAGFECYRETPFELWRYYVHSRQLEALPSFRRVCFLPYVAQMVRAPMLQALEFFIECNPFCRFWTFSSGVRVRLSGIRDRTDWLHAKLRELNKQEFMKAAGVRLVFRATELGTPETDANGNVLDGGEIERDADGQLYFHVHAHVVVELAKGFIPPEKWSRLIARVGAFWPAWWGEGGAIRNARECCKYVTKPGEMLKLTGEELVALQEQLSRAKLVQPLGRLAEDIKSRETNAQRLVKRTTEDGKVFHVVKNWNRHGRKTRTEKTAEAAAKLERRDARGDCRVISRGVPRFGSAGVSEPVVTVMAMRGCWNESTVRGHALVAPLIRATVHHFAEGVARKKFVDRISVHTRTPTGETKPARPRGKPRVRLFWPSEVGLKT